MMLKDSDFSLICYSSYWITKFFDTIFQGDTDDQVWVGVKHYGSTAVICFRGSSSLLDWHRDFEANMVADEGLGPVEQGFMIGLRDLYPKLKKELSGSSKVYVTGHSLGAARALLYGALMVLDGQMPEIITFGSPRPGGQKLKDILAPVEIRSYKNAFDPITNLPLMLSFDPYVHPRDLISVACQPVLEDPLVALRDHHVQMYSVALSLKIGGYQ